jgi:hypothetical protein
MRRHWSRWSRWSRLSRRNWRAGARVRRPWRRRALAPPSRMSRRASKVKDRATTRCRSSRRELERSNQVRLTATQGEPTDKSPCPENAWSLNP